ncbi:MULTISPECIES: hypothetical protein [Halorussus]|uniref:hypothetical protein n=1 Tax=Halorussus TaxID=1070314 RepID=UPI000E20CC0C|nr:MULTISPECIES: hypothetical protein [Halorussus]NHN61569.1 hypothetical protein [Halorussus sp. JP-T4]
MYGILTSSPALVREDVGDFAHFVAEDVSGRRGDPLDGAINSVACWGDTQVVADDPERAAVAGDGTRATPDAEGHHWGTVCPTDSDYRAGLLDRVETVGAAGDVRLTTVGFPGAGFCRCSRCDRQFAAIDRDDRVAWRTETVTEFVRDASDRVAGDLLVTLYPDPYPGNLRERAGLDPESLAPLVDGFLVPLCGIGYETTYWVESLARGFARELGGLDARLTVQLSASEAGADRLVDVTRQIDPHADAVVYGTDEENVDTTRAVLRRCGTAEPPSPPA